MVSLAASGSSSSSCKTGTCGNAKRKAAHERASERALELERRQAEAQRLEQLIEGEGEGIELEGLSESEDGKASGRSEL